MLDIPKKESLTIEFKSDRKRLSDSDIIDAVVGLANTEGGTLYLGIEDNGTITGLHSNHRDCLMIATFDFFEQMIKPWNPERELDFGLLRIPIPEFDYRAFREALINAFSHRDYTILQMTRVLIDDDGLTISNPGSFIEGANIKNLISADPHGRNPALAVALKRIGLAERTGRGIDRIHEGSIIYSRPLPDYSESDETSVKVFIARGLPDITFYKMIKEEQNRLGQLLSINQLLVLSLLRSHKKLFFTELSELTNITEIKLKAILVRLQEIGLIENIASGRSRAYILSARVYEADNRSIEYVHQTTIDKVKYPELVMKLAETQEAITARDITILLNITMTQARYLLNKLIEQNKLIKEGSARNTVYRLKK